MRSKKYLEKYNLAKKMILEGYEFNEICEHLKMDRQILRENFQLHGISVYNQNYDKNRFSNIFQTINTEEKAYWLGLLYADGYISEVENRIELTLKDQEHVEKFKKFINAQNKVTTKKVGEHKYYRISLRDKKMTEDLVKKGCFQKKSLTITFPTLKQVPKELQRHFLRGYFDGDGCISISKITNKATITVISTKNFLNKMCKIFELKQNTYNRCGEAYEWRSASKQTVSCFLNALYKDSKIYLDRKYELYLQIAVLDGNV